MSLDLQPHLQGDLLRLRPLEPADREPLWSVARDPLLWEQHPDKTRSEPEGFALFFDAALASRSALTVIERSSGEVAGSTRFYDWDPERREVAIGYTFLARRLWGGPANAQMKRLLLGHAFGSVERVWFHVAATNLRSRRAMEKLGARVDRHGLRQQNGQMLDFCYYRIDREEWRARA